jgi:hypothetical protein
MMIMLYDNAVYSNHDFLPPRSNTRALARLGDAVRINLVGQR